MTIPCLYTTLKNTSGVSKYFGFVRQGVQLAANEEISYAGDISSFLAQSKQYDRVFPSFEAALDAVEIIILKTPAVHLYDATRAEVRVLSIANHVLGSIDPCWGTYSESTAVA
jgi:hypothetical protein